MDIKYSSKGAGDLICCLEIICLLSKGRLPIRQSQLTKSGAGRSLILTVIIFFCHSRAGDGKGFDFISIITERKKPPVR